MEQLKQLIKKYENWKDENPDLDYQYNEIAEFYYELSRSELQELLEFLCMKMD